MKKVLLLILSAVLVLALFACGGETSPTETVGGNEPHAGTTAHTKPVTEPTTDPTEATVDIANWGRTEKFTTNNGEDIDRYQINVPKYLGSAYLSATISEQMDGTVSFISGQTRKMHSVEKTSDIFFEYREYTAESLENLYGVQSKNFNITVDTSDPVTIGDYEMYVHTGVITYDYSGEAEPRSHRYVAYATKLKDSGNCAYWMVYDFSEDQSKGELIAEHALNMARTFREQE